MGVLTRNAKRNRLSGEGVYKMRMVTALFLPFLITTMLIELTPGPNMAWLALTSATQGKRSGFAAVAGIATGLAILALASAMGLAALAAQLPSPLVCCAMQAWPICSGSHGKHGLGSKKLRPTA